MTSILSASTIAASRLVRLALISEPGAGKTRLMATAQAPFYIDTDLGITSALDLLKGKPEPWGISFADDGTSPTWLRIMGFLDAFSTGNKFPFEGVEINPRQYDTLNIDTWTTCGQHAFDYAKIQAKKESRSGKIDPRQQYGGYELEGKEFAKKLFRIHKSLGMNLVVGFHIREGKTDEAGDVIENRPYILGKALPSYLMSLFDETWALEGAKGGRPVVAHTQDFNGLVGLKSRHNFPPTIVKPSIVEILNTLKGEKK